MPETISKKHEALPFKYEAGWSGIPNAIFELYSFHPKFTASCLMVYIFLIHRYNASIGYAYPTHDQMADALGLSRLTIIKSIKALKELDLIIVDKISTYDNAVYFFKAPLSERSIFEDRFPEAIDKRLKHEKTRLNDSNTRHERKENFKKS